MIRYLVGHVHSSHSESLVVLTSAGIGFKVFIPIGHGLKKGNDVSLHTSFIVRENAMSLYGFLSEDELHIFEKLLSVNGVGPKGALAILSVGPLERLIIAIQNGESDYIKQASGIGKKTAEKVILELSGIDVESILDRENALPSKSSEVREVLLSLGFDRGSILEVLETIDDKAEIEEQIKSALSLLRN